MADLIPTDDGRSGSQLDDTLLALAEGAIETLSELTNRSCFCEDFGDGVTKCETCIVREAVAKLERLCYPVVRSVASEDRLNGPERVFFERWVHENRRSPGLNGGCGALELIMSSDPNNHRAPISQRDMDVATAVVQWLGTNCGNAFIWECNAEIARRHELDSRKEWRDYRLHNTPWKELAAKSDVEQAAKKVADDYGRTEHGRRALEREILALMQFVVASEVLSQLKRFVPAETAGSKGA